MTSHDEQSQWEKTEERFAALVRLGGDERTPEHERRNACELAVAMFTRGELRVTSSARWDAVVELVRTLLRAAPHIVDNGLRCKGPYNINGKNGWRCCRCESFNTSGVMHWLGLEFRPGHCTTCGHQRCDKPKPDPAWDPKPYQGARR